MKTLQKRVGERIRPLRKEQGYTLDELSENINVTSGRYLERVERGEINCTLETLQNIAKGLGVDVDEFFTHTLDENLNEMIDLLKHKDKKTKEKALRILRTMLE